MGKTIAITVGVSLVVSVVVVFAAALFRDKVERLTEKIRPSERR